MNIHWAVAKLAYFFHIVDVWDGPLIMQTTAHAMISYSDKIYNGLPTTFFVTQYMIKSIGNQIVSASLPPLEVSSGSFWFRILLFIKLLCCFKM